MTEQLKQLKEKVNLMMSDAGIPCVRENDSFTRFALPSLYKKVEDEVLGFVNSGYTIEVEEVYRNNGTNENISLRVSIGLWNHSSGRDIKRVKFSMHDSNKKVERLVNEIIEEYKNLA